MSEIRKLVEDDLDDAVRIVGDAYPGWKIVSAADREKFKEQMSVRLRQDPTAALYGLFRDGTLLGTMALHDFVMNFLGTRLPVGGVGLVAVALDHKKEHVAKEMMAHFLRHCRAQGQPLAALYPFRPDFYRKMGFGYGTKMNEYRVRPDDFPRGASRAQVR
ncbi:MAG: GNAT family N-acetyltransferase, partial [Anaerolineae bacterium]